MLFGGAQGYVRADGPTEPAKAEKTHMPRKDPQPRKLTRM